MAKKKKPRKIPEVVVFTDVNHYPDSLASLVVLAWLADQELINLRGIITEVGIYEIRRRRAMYAKGAMVNLGYPYLRVAPGSDYVPYDDQEENTFPDTPAGRELETLGVAISRSGMTFFQEYIKAAPEKNVYLLLNAPAPDLVKYIKATDRKLLKKVKRIVVMGNVLPEKDEDGNYRPDPQSYNFRIDQPGAELLFKYAQENDLRLTIVPSQSVKDLNLGYEFLEGVEKSKNPVARQLLADRADNPLSMHYDMLSAFCLGDGGFKRAGGTFEQPEGEEKNVFFARVADPELFKQTLIDIFKQKLLPKKITLEQLARKKPEEEETDA